MNTKRRRPHAPLLHAARAAGSIASKVLLCAGLVFGLLLLAGCAEPSDSQERSASERDTTREAQEANVILHPTPESIPADAPRLGSMPSDVPASLQATGRAITEAREVGRVGVREGAKAEMVGGVADVAAGPDGRFYLLDGEFSEVRYTAPSMSTLKHAFGEPGRSPEGILGPEALAASSEADGFLVMANRDRQLKTFSAETFDLVMTEDLGYSGSDVCVMDGRIYVRGVAPGADDVDVVHVYDQQGGLVDSFGTPYMGGGARARMEMSSGAIACDASTRTLVVAFDMVPVVRGYTPDGEEKWTRVVPNFEALSVRETTATQSIEYLFSEGPYDLISSLIPLPDTGHVLLQIMTVSREGLDAGRPYDRMRTHLLSAADGQGALLSEDLPQLYAANATHLVGRAEVAWPALAFLAY